MDLVDFIMTYNQYTIEYMTYNQYTIECILCKEHIVSYNEMYICICYSGVINVLKTESAKSELQTER